MTAQSLLQPALPEGLQPVDLSRHLGDLARLVEVCFGAELDASGLGVVREMQLLSRLGPALHVARWLGLPQHPWDQGYVWVDGGRVVGSVSTARAGAGSHAWIVANVAVLPSHRRQGIAHALMQATLDLIHRQGGREAILQVDDDNLGAVELYRRLGFTRVTTRTTWMRPARQPAPPYEPSPYDLRLRGAGEWEAQLALAARARPEGLAWNQPLRAAEFAPGLAVRFDRFLSGRTEEHWVAEAQGRLAASLVIRANWTDGDRLVLLVDPAHRGRLERPLLTRGLRRLGLRPWPARVEHPADDEAAAAVLRELGFQPARVLRWMRAPIR